MRANKESEMTALSGQKERRKSQPRRDTVTSSQPAPSIGAEITESTYTNQDGMPVKKKKKKKKVKKVDVPIMEDPNDGGMHPELK